MLAVLTFFNILLQMQHIIESPELGPWIIVVNLNLPSSSVLLRLCSGLYLFSPLLFAMLESQILLVLLRMRPKRSIFVNPRFLGKDAPWRLHNALNLMAMTDLGPANLDLIHPHAQSARPIHSKPNAVENVLNPPD